MAYSILDILNDELFGDPLYVEKAIQEERLLCCSTCPHLIQGPGKWGKVCGKCGCILVYKTKYKLSSCPDQPPRWEPESDEF